MISNFPDFYVFWDIPTDQNFVPKNPLNFPDLGNFPTSSNTGDFVVVSVAPSREWTFQES